jgi:hypothetical protein
MVDHNAGKDAVERLVRKRELICEPDVEFDPGFHLVGLVFCHLQHVGVGIQSGYFCGWLGLLCHDGQCPGPTAQIQHMLTGLNIRLCNKQGFVAYIPNDIFLDKVVKGGQEPVT